MAAPAAAQNPSKLSKKKAAKVIDRTDSPTPSAASGAADKTGDDYESPYIKELQKYASSTNLWVECCF
jgi:hypothetical protein